MSDINIIVGAKGGISANGTSANLIKSQLGQALANGIKIKVGIDTATATTSLQTQLNQISRNLSINVGLGSSTQQPKNSSANALANWNGATVSTKNMTQATAELTRAKLNGINATNSENLAALKAINAAKIETAETIARTQRIKEETASRKAAEQAAKKQAAANKNLSKTIASATSTQASFNQYLQSVKPSALKQYSAEITSIQAKLKTVLNGGANAQKAFSDVQNRIGNLKANFKTMGAEAGNVFTHLHGKMKSFFVYLASSALTMAFVRGFRNAVGTVKELNKALVDLQMVTRGTETSAKQLLSTYNKMAQELGSTTRAVAESAIEWQRQGYNLKDTNTLIRDSMILSVVGMVDSAQSAQYLTSAIRGYKVSVEDAIGIVDKLTAVDVEAAVSAGGLADGMARTANSARLAGVDMDTLIGYLASIGEVTQRDMATVGESLKTLFARYSNVKLGKLIDDDGESLNDFETALDMVGIALRDQDGQFRDFNDVLQDVTSNYDKLSSVERSAIATTLGGVRQRENVLVLLENIGKATQYAEIAANSTGTAMEKFGAYEEGLEAKANRMTDAFDKMSTSLIPDEVIGGLYDFGAGILHVVSALDAWPARIIIISTALLSLSAIFKSLAASSLGKSFTRTFQDMGAIIPTIRATGVAIQQMSLLTSGAAISSSKLSAAYSILTPQKFVDLAISKNLGRVQFKAILDSIGLTGAKRVEVLAHYNAARAKMVDAAATHVLTGATFGLATGIKTLLFSNPMNWIFLAISLATILIPLFKSIHKTTKELRDEYTETEDALQSLTSELETTKDRIKELQELSNNGTITLIEQEELDNLLRSNTELERQIRLKKEAAQIEAETVNKEINEDFNKLSYQSLERKNAFNDYNKIYAENKEVLTQHANGTLPADLTREELEQIDDLVNKLNALEEVLNNPHIESVDPETYYEQLKARYDMLKSIPPGELSEARFDELEAVRQQLVNLGNELQEDFVDQYIGDDEVSAYYKSLVDSIDATLHPAEHFTDLLNELPAKVQDLLKSSGTGGTLTASSVETLSAQHKELAAWMDRSGYTAEEVAAHYNAMGIATDGATDSTQQFADSLSGLQNTFAKLKSDKELQQTAIDEMSGGGGLSLDTIKALAEAEANYIDFLNVENGVIKLNTEAWEKRSNKTFAENTAGIKDTISALEKENDVLQKQSDFSLRGSQLSTDGTTPSGIATSIFSQTFTNGLNTSSEKINENTEAIAKNQKLLDLYQSLYEGIDTSTLTDPLKTQLDNFSAMEKGVSSLSAVLNDYKKNGIASANSMENLFDTFGNLTSFEKFVQTASDSKSTMSEVQTAANMLAQEYINFSPALSGLTEETAGLAIAQLKSIGVTNAEEVVLNRLNAAKAEAIWNTLELSSSTFEQAEAQLLAAGATTAQINALKSLRTEQFKAKIAATDLSTASSSVISSLLEQANAAGIAGKSIAILTEALQIQKQVELGQAPQMAADYVQRLLQSVKDDASLFTYEDVVVPTVSVSMPTSSGGGSKDVEAYIAKIDDLRHAIKRLDDAKNAIETKQAKINLVDEDDIETLERMNLELIALYQNKQAALHSLNQARDTKISKIADELRTQGFVVEYDPESNDFFVKNMERLKELSAGGQEETNALIKKCEELIKSAQSYNKENIDGSLEWLNIQSNINDLYKDNENNRLDALENQRDALSEIVDLVKDMIKQEKEDEIEALEAQKDAYKEIISLKQKSLELTERERSYQEDVDGLNKEIQKLQEKADLLALASDDRASQLERGQILEELAEKEKELADRQHEYSVDNQKDALDKQYNDFEKQTDDKITIIRDFLADNEALTKAAYDRIDQDGAKCFNDLTLYCQKYTSTSMAELTNMWSAAQQAAEKYGSVVSALGTIDAEISAANGNELTSEQKQSIISTMKHNSERWHTATPEEQASLAKKNEELALRLDLDPKKNKINGRWYWDDGTPVYHNGGEVGATSPRSDELYALIKKKEFILTQADRDATVSMLRAKQPQFNFPEKLMSMASRIASPTRNISTANQISPVFNVYPRDFDDFMTQVKKHGRDIGNVIAKQFA